MDPDVVVYDDVSGHTHMLPELYFTVYSLLFNESSTYLTAQNDSFVFDSAQLHSDIFTNGEMESACEHLTGLGILKRLSESLA